MQIDVNLDTLRSELEPVRPPSVAARVIAAGTYQEIAEALRDEEDRRERHAEHYVRTRRGWL